MYIVKTVGEIKSLLIKSQTTDYQIEFFMRGRRLICLLNLPVYICNACFKGHTYTHARPMHPRMHTRTHGSWARYPVWQHTFVSPSAFSRRAVVSYWRKYVHEVLVNRLGGLSLPRKSMVRLTDRPDMTLDVYRGRKTTMQQQCNNTRTHIHKQTHTHCTENAFKYHVCILILLRKYSRMDGPRCTKRDR